MNADVNQQMYATTDLDEQRYPLWCDAFDPARGQLLGRRWRWVRWCHRQMCPQSDSEQKWEFERGHGMWWEERGVLFG